MRLTGGVITNHNRMYSYIGFVMYPPFARLSAITRTLGNSSITLNTRSYTARTGNTCANRVTTSVVTTLNYGCIVLNRSRHHRCCNRASRALGGGVIRTCTGNLAPVCYINRGLRRHRTNGRFSIIGTRVRRIICGLATRRCGRLIVTCRPI